MHQNKEELEYTETEGYVPILFLPVSETLETSWPLIFQKCKLGLNDLLKIIQPVCGRNGARTQLS
jgi:hypothetical protein